MKGVITIILMCFSLVGSAQTMILNAGGGDKIRAELSSSLAAYDAAAADDAVEVTLSEFNAVAPLLVATGFWEPNPATNSGRANGTWANDETAMPANSFLYAFRVHYVSSTSSTVTVSSKVKISTDQILGYTDKYILPDFTFSAVGQYAKYFVVKHPTPESNAYFMALRMDGFPRVGDAVINGGDAYGRSGDASDLDQFTNIRYFSFENNYSTDKLH